MATKLTWNDLLIASSDLDQQALTHSWAWLVQGRVRVLAASMFGDWFLQRPDGTVAMLDAMEGRLCTIASCPAEFQQLLNTREKQEEWLLSELVFTLHEQNVIPAKGQCYSFKIPPVLGGKAVSDNVELADFGVWAAICGQIHEQVRSMPKGTRISGFRVED